MDELLSPILGSAYCQLDKAEQVTGRFNAHHYGKLLMSLEEAVWAGAKDAEGALKTLISSPTFFLEGKGKDGRNVKSYSRLVFLSNERRAVPATHGERRFFAMRASDEKINDTNYFSELVCEIENGGREAFLYELMHYEGLDIIGKHPPMTDALLEDIEEGMEPFDQWVYSLLDDEGAIYGEPPSIYFCSKYKFEHYCLWGSEILTSRLLTKFQKWLEDRKKNGAYLSYTGISDIKKFSKEFNRLFGCKKKINNLSHFALPQIREARKIFEEHIGRELPWVIAAIDDAKIFRESLENNQVIDKFRREHAEWEAEVYKQSRDARRSEEDMNNILSTPPSTFEQMRDGLRTKEARIEPQCKLWEAKLLERESAERAAQTDAQGQASLDDHWDTEQ